DERQQTRGADGTRSDNSYLHNASSGLPKSAELSFWMILMVVMTLLYDRVRRTGSSRARDRSAESDGIPRNWPLGTGNYSSGLCFTRTTVIFEKPSSKVGGRSFDAILCMTSSGTTRSRRRLRSTQTSTGTSKNRARTS